MRGKISVSWVLSNPENQERCNSNTSRLYLNILFRRGDLFLWVSITLKIISCTDIIRSCHHFYITFSVFLGWLFVNVLFLVHVLCRMASLLFTWLPRRITLRWYGSFWRTTPARVWPLRYCTCVCYCVYMCQSCFHPSYCYSLSPCIFSASVMYGLYICCTNHLHLLSSPFLLLSSRPHSLCVSVCFSTSPCPFFTFLSLWLFPRLSRFTFSLRLPLVFPPSSCACPLSPLPLLLPPTPRSSSLHEGLGRASLIGSVWWWRQSDLESVTDEVRSACCLSSTAAAAVTALIYVAQPVEPIHTRTYESPHVYAHKHMHIQR